MIHPNFKAKVNEFDLMKTNQIAVPSKFQRPFLVEGQLLEQPIDCYEVFEVLFA